MECERISAYGTGCDLEAGHDGGHARHYPDYTVRWDDESDRRFVDAESRKPLGT